MGFRKGDPKIYGKKYVKRKEIAELVFSRLGDMEVKGAKGVAQILKIIDEYEEVAIQLLVKGERVMVPGGSMQLLPIKKKVVYNFGNPRLSKGWKFIFNPSIAKVKRRIKDRKI